MSTIKPKVREALKRGQFTEVNDDEVDYEFTSPSQFFSQNLTLLPMISTVQSQRQFYTDKFFNQALPLVHGEAPLVRSLKDEKTGETFESYIGNQTGVVRAEDDDDGATITDVSPDYIKYKTKAGDIKTRSIYNNLAFNRKTYVTNTPLVKKGDTIKKGQLLAKSNYTDNEGNLNMGLNARIAVVPYKGWSFEDAVVISEDFAKRLASQHMYSMSQDFSSADERKNTTTNRDHFTSLFPKKFTKDQLTNIDENGVVKVGTVVKHGDPLILATRPRMVSSKDSDLGRLSKYLGKTRTDASLSWEHEADGIVTDVVKTKHGWKVNVRSEQPARPGDKLSIGRSGSKGTISKIIPQNLVPRTLDGRPVDVLFNPLGIPCYSSDTEILTDKGWISVVAADGSYKYMTLNPDTWCMELQEASHIHHYDYNGPMYHLETRQLSLLTTPNHNQFVMKRGKRGSTSPIDLSNELKHKELFNLIESKDVFGKTFKYLKAAKWVGVDPVTIEIPEGTKGKTGTVAPGFTVTSEQWAEFMGWFLSEGYTTINKGKKGNSYIVGICQSSEVNPEKYERIKSLLDDMGVNYFIRPREFVISHKGLYEKLEPLGKCRDKYIPQEILQMTPELLNVFLKSLFAGDGNCYTNLKTGHVDVLSYTTSSKKLIDGVQEVYAKLGRICNIKREKRRGEQACYYATIQKGDAGSWINWSDKTKTQQIEEWVDYDGQVHCVTVPNGIVFVRRNGKAVFSGNSRVNANLIMSMMLGKVADKTGKPIKIKSFNNRDEKWYEYVENLMKEHNITDVEDLYDPEKDRLLDNPVTVGNDYIIKMHHTAESKFSARGAGPVYTSDEQPARGGEPGLMSKQYSGLENNGIFSAGAYEIAKDAIHLRGQKNDDYWRAVRNGETPTLAKKSPFVWDKYIALMQGAGINTIDRGNGILQASPFTDRQFQAMNPKELDNPYIVDLNNMKPVVGGLFDPTNSLTDRWGKITLNEPYPNPGFEDAIANLLGLKKSEMYKVMTGEKDLNGKVGTKALQSALKSIDMDKMMDEAKQQFKHGPKSLKQKALNTMRYIKGLKANGLTPDELMITMVPILPSKFRPYSAMGDTFIPGDANELYKDVFQMRNAQKQLEDELGPEEAMQNSMNMYASIKALYGFGDSLNKKIQQRGVSGFLDKLVGGTSKFSYLNRHVNAKPVDLTARSVIDVDPDLGMNEIGLPTRMAYTLFGPYIQQKLVQWGMSPAQAVEAIAREQEHLNK